MIVGGKKGEMEEDIGGINDDSKKLNKIFKIIWQITLNLNVRLFSVFKVLFLLLVLNIH